MTEATEATEATADEAPPSGGRRSPRWRVIALVVVVLAVGIMAWVFNDRFGVDPRLVESPLIGQP
ncbi:MAG: TlpA family protein disulfide reductase, partial [Acidimicrobiia bacterium]|nr:TlpA family protein disulfide reductase [Acidimicrobiia bacterium]